MLRLVVVCDKRGVDLEVTTLGIPLARIPTERAPEVGPQGYAKSKTQLAGRNSTTIKFI